MLAHTHGSIACGALDQPANSCAHSLAPSVYSLVSGQAAQNSDKSNRAHCNAGRSDCPSMISAAQFESKFLTALTQI